MGFAPSLPRPYFSSGHVIRDYHAGACEHAFWHVRFTARSNPTSALTQKTDSFSGTGLFFAYGGESGIRSVASAAVLFVRPRHSRLSRRGLRTCLLACPLYGPFESHFRLDAKNRFLLRNRTVFCLWRREWDSLRRFRGRTFRPATSFATITPGPANMPFGMFALRPVRIPLPP